MNRGIDVSHHNGEIDWDKVSNNNIKFAFAKATERATFQDSKFQDNFQEIKDNDIKAGAYHVFRMTPDSQFENIIDALNATDFSPGDRLAINVTTGICGAGQTSDCDDPAKYTNQERAEKLHSLLTELEEGIYKYKPIVYTSPEIWDAYFVQSGHDFSEYPLWVVDYRGKSNPQLPKDWQDTGKIHDYWNYNDKATIEGITGNVSINSDNFVG